MSSSINKYGLINNSHGPMATS